MKFCLSFALLFSVSCSIVSAQNWIEKNSFYLPQPASSFAFYRDEPVFFGVGGKLFTGNGHRESAFQYYYYNDLYAFDVSTQRWSQQSSAGFAARGNTYGCAIGNKAYVCFGSDYESGINYNDVWEYNPTNGAWTQLVSLPNANPGQTFSSQHFIYSIFGSDSSGNHSNTFRQFDPVTNAWTVKNAFPGNSRAFASVFSVGDSCYVGCGRDTASSNPYNDFWRYDEVNDSWQQKADCIRGGMCKLSYNTTTSGYLLTNNFDSLLAYDPAADSWSMKNLFSGFGYDNNILTFDGQNVYFLSNCAGVFQYDEPNDTWTKIYDSPTGIPFSHVVIVGQQAWSGDNIYDYASDSWHKEPNFSGVNNWMFALGDSGYTYYNGVFSMYDASTGTWHTRAPFPGGASATSFSIGALGYAGLDTSADFWEYNPVNDAWSQKANFPGGIREDASGFSIGQKGYVYSGYDGMGGYFDDFFEFDPDSNMWTQKTSLGSDGRVKCVACGGSQFGYVGLGSAMVGLEFDDLHQYDPLSNSWTSISNPFQGGGGGWIFRRDPVNFVINDSLFVGGGGFRMGSMGAPSYGSSEFYAYDSGINGVKDITAKKTFSVFPSPASNAIVISGCKKGTISIYNSAGTLMKIIFVEDERDVRVNVQDFTPGIFYIQSSNICAKFVKY
jgi:N-acetylneuraminic acid mutarotase